MNQHWIHASAITESYDEFHFNADLDGDGRLDIVVIDKSSGAYRAAYQLVQGVYTWYSPKATGVDGVNGVAVGKWYATDRDAFAVTSVLANRVHIIQAPVPGGPPTIEPVFIPGIGPEHLASLDIGGGGNTIHDDLWTSSGENSAPNPHHISTTRHDGVSFTDINDTTANHEIALATDVILKQGGVRHVAYLGRAGGQDDQLNILSYDSGNAVLVASDTVPENSFWTSGLLVQGDLHHFITWRRGETEFTALEVTETLPDVFGLSNLGSYETGNPIHEMCIVQSDSGPRLLALDSSGTTIRVYAFNSQSGTTQLQVIDTPEGIEVTGILLNPAGGFRLLKRASNSSSTESIEPFQPDGGTFLSNNSADLPTLRRASIRANAFAFAGEPFVDTDSQLLAQFNTPDWTSDPVLQGDQLSVQRETFISSATGLGSKGPVVIGTVPVGTTFALTNQYDGVISLHSYSALQGISGASVDISPVDGLKTQAVRVEFLPQPANAPVYYRLNGGAWILWDGSDVIVNEDTIVQYYGRDPNTTMPTRIGVAHYQFEIGPYEIDSDGDGVPDFVERAKGLDPLGGVDSDGDGYNDLNELLVGKDPSSEDETPDPSERLEENIAFEMHVSPNPVDGTTGSRTTAEVDARLDVFGLAGSSLGGDAAAAIVEPGVNSPGLSLDAVVADARLGYVVAMTEPVYAVTTASEDKDRGRELAGLFEIPVGQLPEIQYTPGNGSLQQEADAWINAALTARNNAVRPIVKGNWTEIDTLAGLLLELKLETIFLARGLDGLLPGKLTLFSGRTGDTGRFAPTHLDLLDLRNQLSESLPGIDIHAIGSMIITEIQSNQAYQGLMDVATAIYEVSSENSNLASPGTYLPPFDVLRAFIRGAALPEPYLSEVGIQQQDLDAAQISVTALLGDLPTRPVDSFNLVVQNDSFGDSCSNLFLLGTQTPVNLWAAPGLPYPGTDGFSLIDGTQIFVTGYTDIIEDSCPGNDIEVLSIVVVSFPPPEMTDENQNLLIDDWEQAFLMGGGDPYGDDDNDGIINLQEMLDGTDPLDPFSKPQNAFDLSPPEILVMLDQNTVTLSWEFLVEYADNFDWVVESSLDFVNWSMVANPVLESPAGSFTVEIPAVNGGIFRVQMILK